jgi:hypothetical protein
MSDSDSVSVGDKDFVSSLLCTESMPLLFAWSEKDTEKFLDQIQKPVTTETMAAMVVRACMANAFVNGDHYGYMAVEHDSDRESILLLLQEKKFDADVYFEGREWSIGINFGPPDEEGQQTPAPSPVIGHKRALGDDEEHEEEEEAEAGAIAKAFKHSDDESTVVCGTQE